MICLQHLSLLVAIVFVGAQYDPDWDSLDTRPLPQWYDDAKIGIMIHWGVYSVPSFGSEWFWKLWHDYNLYYVLYMKNNYRPDFTYADFAPMFTAEFFNPNEWAEIFKNAGARYIVFTSKHHEGFTNWPSKNSWTWNSMDLGPKRDLVGDLANAIRETAPEIHFGLYHSLLEWFHPLYMADKENDFLTNDFPTTKNMPELYDLVNSYQPEIVWSDGDWDSPDWYWNSTVFLAWLFNDSPVKDTVVVNDRWGMDTRCTHGSFFNCEDHYTPGVLQTHKWENAMSLNPRSWGYDRKARLSRYLSIEELLEEVVITISCGGNILINVGPNREGQIPLIQEERLIQLGSWLDVNGEKVYGSRPWSYQNDTKAPGVWYTSNNDTVYAFVLYWPEDNSLSLGSAVYTEQTKVSLLGYDEDLQVSSEGFGLKVTFPDKAKVTSNWAWVLAMTRVDPA